MRLLLALLLLAPAAAAQTRYTADLADGQGGTWTAESTWLPRGVPGPADTVVVAAGRIELADDVSVAAFEFRGGMLAGAGSLTVTESGRWTGGALGDRQAVTDATLVVAAGATFEIRDGDLKSFQSRSLVVDGLLDWTGSDTLEIGMTSDVHIRDGGTWVITGENAFSRSNGSFNVLIDGTVIKTGDGRTTFNYAFGSFILNGDLRVDGDLALVHTSAFSSGGAGTIHVGESATLTVLGGTYDFSGTTLLGGEASGVVEAQGGRVVLGRADFAGAVGARGGELFFGAVPAETVIAAGYAVSGTFGGLTVGAGVTLTDRFQWMGGTLGRVATVVVAPGATFETVDTMGSATPRVFGGMRLVNRGLVDWSSGESPGVTFTVDIENEASGVIELNRDFAFDRTNGFVRLVNDGLIVKRLGTGTTTWTTEAGSFRNRGEVRIETGRFVVEGSTGASAEGDTGRWLALAGAEVDFRGRRFFSPAASLEGEGAYAMGELLPFSELKHALRPGLEGIGRMEVSGASPLLDPEGALHIEVGVGAHDVLTSPEAVTLGGTLRVARLAGASLAVGDRLRIVEAAGGATGAFDALDLPPGVSGVVETDAEGAVLLITAVVDTEDAPLAPEALALDAPAPNPASGAAVIGYRIGEAGEVRLSVVDALGREVAVLASGDHAAGAHSARLDASGLAPGVYTAVLAASGERSVRRLTVAR